MRRVEKSNYLQQYYEDVTLAGHDGGLGDHAYPICFHSFTVSRSLH
jgi:hypothetical protein